MFARRVSGEEKWAAYLKQLLNVNEAREASTAAAEDNGLIHVMRQMYNAAITIKEVKVAVEKMKPWIVAL